MIVVFKKTFTLNFFIVILSLAVVFAAGYVIYSTFLEPNHFLEEEVFEPAGVPIEEGVYWEKAEPKSYSKFVREIERKEIFSPPYFEEEEQVAEISREEINLIIENLRLVGIKSGVNKRAIIEDKQLGKTFYLKEGDVFSDNVKIEKIEGGMVLLNCYGESFELYL
jgi:hypothetical protein